MDTVLGLVYLVVPLLVLGKAWHPTLTEWNEVQRKTGTFIKPG